MEKLLCPSMMCANFANLEKEVKDLDEAGIDIFHLDIMDGQFVPNFGMGLQDVELIRKSTNKMIDVHLMIMNPGNYVEKFADLGCDIIYIHPEADLHPARTLQKIKDAGKAAGIAVNPGTSFETVKDLLNLCDYVLVMSVNPGFAGQKYIDFVNEKFEQFCAVKDKYGYKVVIDGSCSPEKIEMLSKIGVEGFVLGTSAMFGKGGKGRTYPQIVEDLRKL